MDIKSSARRILGLLKLVLFFPLMLAFMIFLHGKTYHIFYLYISSAALISC